MNELVEILVYILKLYKKRGAVIELKLNMMKKKSIKAFIESLNCVQSHYCRSEYICHVIWILQNSKKIYSEKYPNIPAKFLVHLWQTVCSTCLRAKESLKKAIITQEQKTQIITEQRVHTLKAKVFYSSLQSEEYHINFFFLLLEKLKSTKQYRFQVFWGPGPFDQ